MIVPTVLEPSGQLVAGIMVEHVYVQFALLREPREGQVATAEVSDSGIDGIWPEQQIELGMEWMLEE